MKVEILYIADCPNHGPTVERVWHALKATDLHATVTDVEVLDAGDAERRRFIGSPTVRVNGLDVEPEAREIQRFGLGCRSYVEDGRRSGLPSEGLIRRALTEQASNLLTFPTAASASPESEVSASGRNERGALAFGGLAAILASTCCLGPLILVGLGFSGAWISNLAVLEPFRPWFLAVALIALFFAGRTIFRKADSCAPGEVCALPQTRRTYKLIFGLVSVLIAIGILFPYVARFFY